MKRCPACGGAFAGEAWHCPACGFEPAALGGFPAFAPALAEEAPGYDASHYRTLFELESGHFWFEARNRLIAWAIARYLPGARSFCEVGCGTGYVLAAVREALPGAELWASEVFAEGLAFAAQRAPGARLMQMDACDIPYVEEFDAIGAFDVLEHIARDRDALAQMMRALRPGGRLVLTVPQHRWLWSAADDAARHVRRYSAAGLRQKLAEAGLRIECMTSFVSLLLPAMALSRLGGARVQRDPYAELRIGAVANRVLSWVMAAERALIRAGVRFPAGGSLLAVASKP